MRLEDLENELITVYKRLVIEVPEPYFIGQWTLLERRKHAIDRHNNRVNKLVKSVIYVRRIAAMLVGIIILSIHKGSIYTIGELSGSGITVLTNEEQHKEISTDIVNTGDVIAINSEGYGTLEAPYYTINMGDTTIMSFTSDKILTLQEGHITFSTAIPITIVMPRGRVLVPSHGHIEAIVSNSGVATIDVLEGDITIINDTGVSEILSKGRRFLLQDTTKPLMNPLPKEEITALDKDMTVRSILDIVRTKALSILSSPKTLDDDIRKNKLRSAKGSYLSVIQVLSDTPPTTRFAPDIISYTALNDTLLSLTNDASLQQEIQSTTTLLSLINQFGDDMIRPQYINITLYDRYQMLETLKLYASVEEKRHLRILQSITLQSFVDSVLLKSDIPLDQLKALTNMLDALPNNTMARQFIEDMKQYLPIRLREILG